MEARVGIEPTIGRFAGVCLSTWPTRLNLAGVERLELSSHGFGDRHLSRWTTPLYVAFQLSKSIKQKTRLGAGLLNPDSGWILPAPAAPWIRRHDGVIDDLPMGAHEYAARPTLPLALRFGFGESQHDRSGAGGGTRIPDCLLTRQVQSPLCHTSKRVLFT